MTKQNLVKNVTLGIYVVSFLTSSLGGVVLAAPQEVNIDRQRQQLSGREAAIKAKEEELNRLYRKMDNKVNDLDAARKSVEKSLVEKKKQDEASFVKMIKIYKGLKPSKAAELLNKQDSVLVIKMLNRMDQKTVVKLIPFLTQPTVLEWTRLNMASQ